MLNIKIDKRIDVIPVSVGYSLKIDNCRLCNVKELENGLFSVKCRSKVYANLFPCDYNNSGNYLKETRNYGTYTTKLTKKELENWLTAILKIDLNKRLDNR